jgi:SAM-dependent methyltransferase
MPLPSTSVPPAPEPNAAQAHHWNAEAGPAWVLNEQQLDAMLEPFSARLLESAAPLTGERVLDIGCGCGATTIALSEAAGPSGAVLGIDISAPMLDRARERVEALGLTNVEFLRADAQQVRIEGQHDLAISRFGVMFFEDLVAAFTNIGRGLREGGRLTFVCWQAIERNPWMKVPIDAVLPFVTPPPPAVPDAPGPYALADPDRIERVLSMAGFSRLRIDRMEGDLALGGARTLDAATAFSTQTGALRALLGPVDDPSRTAAIEAVRRALAPYSGSDGVQIGFAAWIVSARWGVESQRVVKVWE